MVDTWVAVVAASAVGGAGIAGAILMAILLNGWARDREEALWYRQREAEREERIQTERMREISRIEEFLDAASSHLELVHLAEFLPNGSQQIDHVDVYRQLLQSRTRAQTSALALSISQQTLDKFTELFDNARALAQTAQNDNTSEPWIVQAALAIIGDIRRDLMVLKGTG